MPIPRTIGEAIDPDLRFDERHNDSVWKDRHPYTHCEPPPIVTARRGKLRWAGGAEAPPIRGTDHGQNTGEIGVESQAEDAQRAIAFGDTDVRLKPETGTGILGDERGSYRQAQGKGQTDGATRSRQWVVVGMLPPFMIPSTMHATITIA